jgi:hypothetical protein
MLNTSEYIVFGFYEPFEFEFLKLKKTQNELPGGRAPF